MYLREVDIIAFIREGKSRREIGQLLHKKWNVTAQAIEKQHDKIVDTMRDELIEKRENLRSELLERTDYLYQKALEEGKIKTAIDAINAKAKIAGLFNERDENRQERPQTIEIIEQDQSVPRLTSVKKADNG